MFVTEDTSIRDWLVPWLSIVTAYTVAATTANPKSGLRSLVFKACVISVVSILAIAQHPETWKVTGLFTEAIIAGIFEAKTFGWYLTISVRKSQSRGQFQLVGLLALVIAGHLVVPQVLSLLGLPTHLSLKLPLAMDSSLGDHMLTVHVSAFVYEVLVLGNPSIFPRLQIGRTPDDRRVLTQSYTVSSRILLRITAFHILGLFFLLNMVCDTVNAMKHPLALLREHAAILWRAQDALSQLRILVSQGIRLLLLCRRKSFAKFTADIWAGTDLLKVTGIISRVGMVVCEWLLAIMAVLAVLYYIRRRSMHVRQESEQ